MRPISLNMSAFGPFAGNEFINFSLLGRNPLFLLNGPTGAGKTTILDAMCFALYGKSTGDEREAAQMRCDLADESLLTEVSFEFELGDLRYRIRRVPEQARLKKSGDGYTQQKPEAQLVRIEQDGSESLLVPAKVSEANSEIERLTGLDADQFRQVMVLPQGKFRQLLMADSKEREKIFSQLFQTHIYRRIEESLKSQAASIRSAATEQKNIREGILQSANLSEESSLEQELDQLKPALEAALAEKKQAAESCDSASKQFEAAKLLSADFTELTALKAAMAELNKQKSGVEKQQQQLEQARAALAIEPFDKAKLQRFNEAKQASLAQSQSEAALTNAKLELKEAEQQFALLPEKQTLLGSAEEQQRVLLSFKPLIAELERLTTELKVNKDKLSLQTQQGKQLNQQLGDIAAEKTALQQQQVALRQQADTQVEQQKAVSAAEHSLQLGQQLTKLDETLASNQQLIEQSIAQGQRMASEYNAAQQHANQIQLSWHQGQAAIMAQRLHAGDACPVCGSIEHPQLAQSLQQLPTESDVEQARLLEQRAQEKLSEARQQHKALTVQQAAWSEQHKGLIQQLANKAQLSVEQLSAELLHAKQALEAAQHAHAKVTALQTQLEQNAQSEQVTQQNIEQARELYQQIRSQVDVLQGQLDQAQQRLPEQYREANLLEQAIELQLAKVTQLKQTIQQLNDSHAKAREALTAAQAAGQAAQQNLKLAQNALAEAQQIFAKQLEQSSFANENAFNMALISDQEIAELDAAVASFNQQYTTKTAQFDQLKQKLKGKKAQDLVALEQALKDLVEKRNQTDTLWNQLNSRTLNLSDIQQKLLAADKNAEGLQAKYQVVGTLADVANGQTGNKISLQRFVLSVLLDDVLLQASQRLQLMSKGRYQLIRKEQRAKGNKASGLELEVEDSYTSKVRSVATLSGGESFMAALAMALGLSDVVQAYAGGIKLDTLFIDEGFGSLDQESLDLAIRTLIDLQSSGRMVGVISHVAEMKEQITSRIDVTKSGSGSAIQLIVP
ncbi:SMC family ATPase [Agarivorans sp. TSD2052]|uniref:AAA family ATPase n=1 Tax=Agarivorans sp. TSD2052 TaxID=2937286 RepID=UPI00200F6C63|nr:SMC family ATPase [Agarivorans sp. TSD2052]UPW16923.1 SMC family ATPase [Agarivorans sp. TSD2052]